MGSVKNRFQELKQIHPDTSESEEIAKADIKIGITEKSLAPELIAIYEKVNVIRAWIEEINSNTRFIKEFATNNLTSKKLTFNELENRSKNTTTVSLKISKTLKELDVSDKKESSAVNRIKKIQYGTLRQEFQKAVFENSEALEKYREGQKVILKKQAALMNSNLQEEELQALLDNPNSAHLFTENILIESQYAKLQLQQIEERHNELLKIEKCLQTIRNLFAEIAVLVEEQQDQINRVEFYATGAQDYVDKGLVEIQEADGYRKKTKKKFLCISIGVVVIIIVIILMVLL